MKYATQCYTLALFLLLSTVACQADPLRIMPLGDSITEGYYACSYRKPLVEGLAGCDFDMVGSQNGAVATEETCLDTQAYHQGIGGWQARSFLEDMGDGESWLESYVADYQPDLVLLHIGSNDLYGGHAPGTYHANTRTGTDTVASIDDMITQIYARQPNATILLANLIPWLADDSVNIGITQLRPHIAALVNARATVGDKIALVDVYSGFSAGMLSDDAIHPNTYGENHIAARFKAAMQTAGFCTSATGDIPAATPPSSDSGTEPEPEPEFQVFWNRIVTLH